MRYDNMSARWDRLYSYIKELYGYDNNQELSKYTIDKIKSISKGVYLNNNKSSIVCYNYDVIFNTFLYKSNEIKYALSHNEFNDEKHKTNYIFKIIEPALNDVYIRMKKADKEMESLNIDSYYVSYENNFQPRNKKNYNKKYDDMW